MGNVKRVQEGCKKSEKRRIQKQQDPSITSAKISVIVFIFVSTEHYSRVLPLKMKKKKKKNSGMKFIIL